MNSLIINTPVQAGIHTFNLRTEQRPINLDKINSAVLDAGFLERTKKWFLELDINLVNGCIDQYSVHCKTLNHLMNQISVTDYTYYRTDICIDWFVKIRDKQLDIYACGQRSTATSVLITNTRNLFFTIRSFRQQVKIRPRHGSRFAVSKI